ncbi:MAG: hypothetical protein HC875_40570 [Anaerolineales bacterium]|nr:hypothetical protein [Anaerolineales bacterium]
MKPAVFDKVMRFLDQLEQDGISYTLAHYREEALLVNVAVPGERWEIEFLTDGRVEIERFVSRGEIADETGLADLFARYGEAEQLELTPQEAALIAK